MFRRYSTNRSLIPASLLFFSAVIHFLNFSSLKWYAIEASASATVGNTGRVRLFMVHCSLVRLFMCNLDGVYYTLLSRYARAVGKASDCIICVRL